MRTGQVGGGRCEALHLGQQGQQAAAAALLGTGEDGAGAAGGFVGGALRGGRRIAGAVYERWLITLDADEAGPDDWDCAAALCDWAMCAYTTHSHSPEHPRLRWVIPLRRAVTREEYEPLCRKVAELLGVMETLDASTYQAERLMYWPTAASDGEYICREQDGALLDPDALLAMYGPEGAWKDVSLWPMADREREIVRQRVRMAMGKLPNDVMYTDSDSTQVVHVIPCACEGCPISKITVTPNCQSCLAKKCVKACPFGAITASKEG